MKASLGMLIATVAAPAIAQAGTGEESYTNCLKRNAVKYGAENSESAETVIKVAKGECSIVMRQVMKDAETNEYLKREFGKSLGIEADSVVERAEGEAIKALLEARSERPQTE